MLNSERASFPGDEVTSVQHFETKLGGNNYWVNTGPWGPSLKLGFAPRHLVLQGGFNYPSSSLPWPLSMVSTKKEKPCNACIVHERMNAWMSKWMNEWVIVCMPFSLFMTDLPELSSLSWYLSLQRGYFEFRCSNSSCILSFRLLYL